MTAYLMILAASVLVACGGSNSSSSSSPTPSPSASRSGLLAVSDACKLVTAEDASTAVGTSVTNLAATQGVTIPGACFYGTSDGSASVLIFAQAYSDASSADQIQPDQIAAAFRAQYGITNAKSVTGIGDKAFEYTATSASGSPGIAIFVFKANVVMFIVMSPSTDSAKIEALAKTAVSRLS